jgi:hypothetical protein
MKVRPQRTALVAAFALACVTAALSLPLAASAQPTSAQACGVVKHFSGNGGKNLGTLTFARDSTLAWTNDGDIFQIFSAEGVPVNSQAHRGTTVIDKGTEHKFQVNAIGNWRLTFTPRCASAATSGSRFSGNGGKNLGTIRVAKESVLTWTNTGDIFQIYSDEGIPANSQAHRGTTVLDAGTYHHFQVNAIGSWTISIKAK